MCEACPNLSDEACYAFVRDYLRNALAQAKRTFVTTNLSRLHVHGSPPPNQWLGKLAADLADRTRLRAEMNDHASISLAVDRALKHAGHNLAHDSESWHLFASYFQRARVEEYRYEAHLFANGVEKPGTWEPVDALFAQNGQESVPRYDRSIEPNSSPPKIGRGTSLETVCDAFISENAKGLKERSARKYAEHLRLAQRYFGKETGIATIDRILMRGYRNTLITLPRDFQKISRFRSMPLAQIAALPASERGNCLAPASINAYLGTLAQVFSYGSGLGYCGPDNPVKGMSVKDHVKAKDKRDAFTKEHIATLLRQPIFAGWDGCHLNKSGAVREAGTRFWVPLIALFSGMRRAEIFGLNSSRIIKEDGHLAFDIREAKTERGIRKVPVHPFLVSLGFFDFAASIPTGQPFFADMSADALGKFFARVIDAGDFGNGKLTFHSLRHSFIDAARHSRISSDYIRALVGHSDGSVTDNYGHGYSLSVLAEEMGKISFWDIDVGRLGLNRPAPASPRCGAA